MGGFRTEDFGEGKGEGVDGRVEFGAVAGLGDIVDRECFEADSWERAVGSLLAVLVRVVEGMVEPEVAVEDLEVVGMGAFAGVR